MLACTNCGTPNEDHAVYCQKCGAALETSQATRVENSIAVENYGGFWKRVLAWFIDMIVVGAGTGIVIASTLGIGVVVAFFGHWLYEAFMTSSSWQATVGKRAMNMIVTDTQGRPISFARATGRHFAKWISAMALGIGFIIVAFNKKKQGLHDMIAETVVVIR